MIGVALVVHGLNWIGRVSLQASVLVGLVLLLQWLWRDHLAPRWRYALWWLVVIRLMIPISFESSLSIFNFTRLMPTALPKAHLASGREPGQDHPRQVRGRGPEPARNSSAPLPVAQAETARPITPPAMSAPSAGPSKTWSVREWLGMLWLAGIIGLGSRLSLAILVLCRQLRRGRQIRDPKVLALVEECRRLMKLRQQLELIETPIVQGPALFGVGRARLLLPFRMVETFSREELRYVLLHEMAHLRRRDVWMNWLVTALQVLHWFNPVLWLGFIRMRADRELACDALALSFAREEERESYGQTIIRLWEGLSRPLVLPGLVGVLEDKIQMQRRIRMIAQFKKTSRWPGFAVVLLTALGVLTLTDARSAKENRKTASIASGGSGRTAKTAAGNNQDRNAAPPATAGLVGIVDPGTGLKFTLARQITGENDVILHDNKLSLAPSGKFLLWWGKVVPLDGRQPFNPAGLPNTGDAAWSPDGKWIAYHDRGRLCVLPVSPETGGATGPPKLLRADNAEWVQGSITWSADSERILFAYNGQSSGRGQGCIAIRDGKLIQPPDYTGFGILSPDRKAIAYAKPGYSGGVWLAPATGEAPRLAASSVGGFAYVPLWWSPDGEWLLCGSTWRGSPYQLLRFVHCADRWEYVVTAPEAVGNVALGISPDRKKLLFYRNSHELRPAIKVATVPEGAFAEVKMPRKYDYVDDELCSPVGRRLIFLGMDSQGNTTANVMTLTGGTPVEIKIKGSFDGEVEPVLVSPDGKQLLLAVNRGPQSGQRSYDFYVQAISLDSGESRGTPALIFKDWRHPAPGYRTRTAWSPDSKRLVMSAQGEKNGDLWLVSADGSSSQRLTDTPDELENSPSWSPDGAMVAYTVASAEKTTLYAIQANGGTPRAIWTQPGTRLLTYAWFPNSKEIGVLSNEVILAIAIADGKARSFLNGADLGFDWLQWFQWSPDRQTLGIYGGKRGEHARVALFRTASRKIEKLPGDPAWNLTLRWTADSQAIYCVAEQPDRKLPAGLIYEMDLADALAKAKTSLTSAPSSSASSSQPLKAPPLTNGEYRDSFEDGETKYWTFQDLPNEGPNHLHEVRQGELLLENSRVNIGSLEWTNYIVKVRMCVKQLGAPGRTLTGVGFRRGPQGSYLVSAEPRGKALWLGAGYTDNAKQFRVGTLTESPCDFLLDKWYAIQVEARGSHLKVLVDGQLVVNLQDESFARGAIGLLAGSARVHFDDFSLQLLPE